jgi:hypothetical protein
MTDRNATFARVLALEPGRPALVVDIIGRAFGRVVSSTEILDTVAGWQGDPHA